MSLIETVVNVKLAYTDKKRFLSSIGVVTETCVCFCTFDEYDSCMNVAVYSFQNKQISTQQPHFFAPCKHVDEKHLYPHQ